MARKRSAFELLRRRISALGRGFRLAVFGRQRPRSAVRDAMLTSAEGIDPAEADPRAVGPADLPQEVGGPGGPRIVEPRTGSTHAGGPGHDHLHIPRE